MARQNDIGAVLYLTQSIFLLETTKPLTRVKNVKTVKTSRTSVITDERRFRLIGSTK
jgi:hypothetical protein